jgi:hypothetical protein
MKLEKLQLKDQVVSLDRAKRLKEMGVPQNAVYQWITFDGKAVELVRKLDMPFSDYYRQHFAQPIADAFTVAELGAMLPEFQNDPHEADARAQMLIALLEAGLIIL